MRGRGSQRKRVKPEVVVGKVVLVVHYSLVNSLWRRDNKGDRKIKTKVKHGGAQGNVTNH